MCRQGDIMLIEATFKRISATTDAVKNGTELSGLWPIQRRRWEATDFTVSMDRRFVSFPSHLLDAIAAGEVVPTAEEGEKEVEKYGLDLYDTITPARPEITIEDLVALLNNSDDLAARGAMGPWKVKASKAEARAVAVEKKAAEDQAMFMKVMDYLFSEMRDGRRPAFFDLPEAEKPAAIKAIYASNQYATYAAAK
jgi:hypothetical protein